MKIIPLLILHLLAPTFTQFYEQISFLTELDNVDAPASIDISDDNQIIVAECEKSVYIYIQNLNTFAYSQTIADSSAIVGAVDITADGQILLVVQGDGNIVLYQNINNTFTHHQTIFVSGTTNAFAGAITDDREWIAFGTHDSQQIFIFRNNGIQYEINQIFPVTYPVWSVEMTPDHTFLVVASWSYQVEVYRHNGTQFELLQQFSYSSNTRKSTSLTEDHQYLTVSVTEGDLYRYSFNQAFQQFQFLDNNSTMAYTDLWHASISENKQLMVVSTTSAMYIYKDIEGSLPQVQQLPGSRYIHKLSTDGQYLIGTETGELRVYSIICNQTEDTFYNSTSGLCEICDNSQNLYFDESGQCIYCNEADLYYPVNGICVLCQSPYFLTKDGCLLCDESQNEYLVDGECFTCGVEGCDNCGEGTCLKCNEELNYFMNNDTCQLCSISHCVDCLSLNQCEECDGDRNFIVNNGVCQRCTLEGCTRCSDKDTCEQCDNSEDYFLLDGQTCSKCPLSGCLDCMNSEKCLVCDQQRDYFLENDVCELCSLEGCLDCQNLQSCLACDESKNYFLTQNATCSLCQLTGCLDCFTSQKCQVCNEEKNYFLLNDLCQTCQIQGCLVCKDTSSCKSCDESKDYFLEGDNCAFCLLEGCLDCSSMSKCRECDERYYTLTEDGTCQIFSNFQNTGLLIALIIVIVIDLVLLFFVLRSKIKPSKVENESPSENEKKNQRRVGEVLDFENAE